ncbi:hypothetical protein BHE74_00040375 [Ensete ventricosum]|nr:hypothetical protein BHE74_00040375 [Ensete ventricosum]RZS23080.1 hypothetical protein BHM03_00055941 [Ensete ventricosum]
MGIASPLAGAVGCSQGPPAKGRPAATWPLAKGQSAAARPPAKGDHPQGQQPYGHDRLRPACKGLPPVARPPGLAARGAIARGNRPRPGHWWRLPAARPQGAALRPGLPPARAAAGRSGRQPARCRPKAAAPAVGAAAHADDVQHPDLRRVATAQMGARRGLGHPVK